MRLLLPKVCYSKVLIACLFAAEPSVAALDLRQASTTVLDNGMTVLLIEERSQPLVSVQMLYRVGARDEMPGKTGLAHFVEHMAFRGSERFPDTGLVSEIYAAGGEWHGYTYLDQTTYFATVPASELTLLLDIEADRMSRLKIREQDIAAEQGAVIAEMQGYENDPAAVLHDAAVFASIIAHPYRNNTIGWESDVRSISRDDVVAFYRRYYHPGNAVLAIVGDINRDDVLREVRARFAGIEAGSPSALPVTVEPQQTGERRVRLTASLSSQWFQFSWPAPAATDPDWPAFLLLQELLSGSAGVNFRQNDWGTHSRSQRPLAGITEDMKSWLMPTAQPYIFAIKGSVGLAEDRDRIEQQVAAEINALQSGIDSASLEEAKQLLLDELILDLQSTEDAAHQLAFFAGIHALDVLLELPERIETLNEKDVSRVARRFLQPQQRTVAWFVNGELPPATPPGVPQKLLPTSVPEVMQAPIPAPQLHYLANGLPVMLQPTTLSDTLHLQVAMPGKVTSASGLLEANAPIAGVTSFSDTVVSRELESVVISAAASLDAAGFVSGDSAASSDPYERGEQLLSQWMPTPDYEGKPGPIAIAVAGNFDTTRLLKLLDEHFGKRPLGEMRHVSDNDQPKTVAAHIDRSLAQSRLLYIVPAAAPDSPQAEAWRAVQYIFSHDYEGRFGKAAISQRGLAYYIDSRYRSDGRNAWVTLSAGVDPGKLDDLEAVLRNELTRLREDSPGQDELQEAVSHRLGRAQTAYMTNREQAEYLSRHWLWHGSLPSLQVLREQLNSIRPADLEAAIESFTRGRIVRVTVD